MDELIIYVIISVLIFTLIFLSVFLRKKNKLTKPKKTLYLVKIKELYSQEPGKKIILFDSMLSHILLDLWYSWNLWEQLKKKPKEIKNYINEIWELHKLRNKIAHELNTFDKKFLEKNAYKYENILKDLLK